MQFFDKKKKEKMGTLWHRRIIHLFDEILKCIFYLKV
jgi:hypothetical protein